MTMPTSEKINTHYFHDPKIGFVGSTFIGVRGAGGERLSVGTENSEAEIKNWLATTLQLQAICKVLCAPDLSARALLTRLETLSDD